MPIPAVAAWAVPAGIGVARSLFSRKPKVKRPTAAINYYSKISEEGEYSPATMNSILGRAGGEAGNAEQQQVADIRGRLTASGMGKSVAGTRTLAMPGQQRIRSLTNLGGRLTAENEASKVDAKRNLAQIYDNYNQAKSDVRTESFNNRLGGVLDAAGGAFAGAVEQENLGEMADFDKLHSGIQAYITGGGDMDSQEFAEMFEQAYGVPWPKNTRPISGHVFNPYTGGRKW